ncbi:MAG: PPOX class F420-dependent oxidoreductase [Acidimicrobiales bacterium]
MELETALRWAGERNHATLITIRSNGRPQSSDISYAVLGGQIKISVTDGRAKTRNLRRDPRAVVHISAPDAWSYISFEGNVELSPVAASPGDDTVAELIELFRAVQGKEHPDWDEFCEAMVADQRLVVRFTPTKATGQIR